MQKWQYKNVTAWNSEASDTLDSLGADGWELVSVLEWGDDKLMLFFKRPSSEPSP